MMRKHKNVILVFFIFGWILTGCSVPPTEEMNQALDAVTRAENNADAVNYAGNILLRAREALANMQSEADAKRYDSAKTYAAEAVSLAARAEEEGRIGALRAREEAARLVSNNEGLLAETAGIIQNAAGNGEIDLDIGALSSELDIADRLHEEAQRALQTNDYGDAVARGQTTRSLLSDINTQVNEAVQAVSGKK